MFPIFWTTPKFVLHNFENSLHPIRYWVPQILFAYCMVPQALNNTGQQKKHFLY